MVANAFVTEIDVVVVAAGAPRSATGVVLVVSGVAPIIATVTNAAVAFAFEVTVAPDTSALVTVADAGTDDAADGETGGGAEKNSEGESAFEVVEQVHGCLL